MNRQLFVGLVAGAAAWLLFRKNQSDARKAVAVVEAATLLKQAWAKNHTCA
jgi:hypothetical protein